jgi:hypothetical protein
VANRGGAGSGGPGGGSNPSVQQTTGGSGIVIVSYITSPTSDTYSIN